MRTKGLLAAFLLGVGLCLMPALGYGEIKMRSSGLIIADLVIAGSRGEEPERAYAERIDSAVSLLWLEAKLNNARIQYIMHNPTKFLSVDCYYDRDGRFSYPKYPFPEDIDTAGKIFVLVTDNRGVFYLSGVALLDVLKGNLETIYSFLNPVATDMDTDIVALFQSGGGNLLGLFYEGEFQLVEK